MRPDRGRSAAGFRTQLLAQLRNRAAADRIAADRLHQRVAFERLLGRLAVSGDWILKGGFALELRYGWANRPTRDIDLRTELLPEDAARHLRETLAGSRNDDYFAFELRDTLQELQGAPGGGLRLRIIARVAGIHFATFGVDLASGDPVMVQPDILQGSDVLSFAGIRPVQFPVYAVVTHLAEKLHAYTARQGGTNTRVKDLVDMITIAALDAVAGDTLSSSIHATFVARGTHALPLVLPPPPPTWAGPFRRLAGDTPAIPHTDLESGYRFAHQFWSPALSGVSAGMWWNPDDQRWGPNRRTR